MRMHKNLPQLQDEEKNNPKPGNLDIISDCLLMVEIKFSMVVQGHSASHLDPSLNTQAKFLHPFKLILIISSKPRGSEVYTDLRSPLIHDYEVQHTTLSLSLPHSYFPLRSLTAGAQ